MDKPKVFLGTDSGATTSKTGGVWADGSIISRRLRQSSTNAQLGTATVIQGWVEGLKGFLAENNLGWDQVLGIGLALPGPYQTYGVLGCPANLPKSFEGWHFHADYSLAIAQAAGRDIPLVAGNDGNYGGVAEAHIARNGRNAGVVLLAPGSGLGTAYVDPRGLPLDGDSLSGMEAGHMPLPLQIMEGVRVYPCGCGRDWGCVEAYTTLSGLGCLLEDKLKKYPTHPLAASTLPSKEKVLSLRGLAQKGDPLANEIFDFQARALGIHAASLIMALDPEFVVVGGGLMDHESTQPEFRERYMKTLSQAAKPYLWREQREKVKFVQASLGELSQAIGAALVAKVSYELAQS
jgi:glucokinase